MARKPIKMVGFNPLKRSSTLERALAEKINEQIIATIDENIKEGLARAGYKFLNREELLEFVKNDCEVIKGYFQDKSNIDAYLAKGKVFMIRHRPELKINQSIDTRGNIKMSAIAGSFYFTNGLP